jgi:hypothetical protein
MDSREGNNFISCGQPYGPDLGFQSVGYGAHPMNAMVSRVGNIFIACG